MFLFTSEVLFIPARPIPKLQTPLESSHFINNCTVYTEKIHWVNLTHLMSLALVPKNTHTDESNSFTNPKVGH